MAEALELSTFMSGISELDGELQRLDQGDWAGDKITPLVFIKRPHYHRSIYDVTISDVSMM